MKTLTKKQLHLMGSAGSLPDLKSLIISRLYWSQVDAEPSALYCSRLGSVYSVGNKKGRLDDYAIINTGRRWGLYWLKS